jgi:aldehyde dehydrogenase (NAD+)
MSVRQPLGVCSIITPWNFPMAIPSWKIIPALVCGNTVVFKPASQTPLSAVNFVRVLEDAGLPKGVVNMVTGDGDEVGTPLTTDAAVRVVSFTGSTGVGRIVNQAAAPSFKKVHLEMGGKNVIMIMDDANLELAVDGCLWGGFGTTGQRCTAASRVVVHERVYAPFVEQFVARAKSLVVGDGRADGTQVGPSISQGQLDTVMNYVRIGKEEGATLACGGHRLDRGALGKGYFHEPTIFTDVDPRMRIAREEIFGPVVSVMRCRSL